MGGAAARILTQRPLPRHTVPRGKLAMLRESLGCVAVALAGVSASAGTIGTFELANLFSPFSGLYLGNARTALGSDGHTLVDLRLGDLDRFLAVVDAVYLPWQSSGNPLSAFEQSRIADYLASGGNVIVQADHDAYDSFLASYGVTTTFLPGHMTTNITSPIAGITSGTAGNVDTLRSYSPWTFGLGGGGSALDGGAVVAVLSQGNGLAAGSGTLVLLGDINQFDGPGNANGWSEQDNAILWRNTFEFASSPPRIPVPASLPLLVSGIGLLGVCLRMASR